MRYWREFQKKRPLPGMYVCCIGKTSGQVQFWMGDYGPEAVNFVPKWWIKLPALKDETLGFVPDTEML